MNQRDEAGRLWVVIVAEPQREALANFTLLQSGITTFWPHYLAVRRPHGRPDGIPVLRSYFAGYLFAGLDDPYTEAPPLGRLRGVHSVIWSETDPHYLPPTWLSRTRARTINGMGLMEPPERQVEPGRFQPGDQVRCRGAWEAFISTVIAATASSVTVAHAEMFGQKVMLNYLPEQVERA